MAMTPEEYAARELNVHGWTEEEPLYAPGSNPSEYDPNILTVMNGGDPKPTAAPPIDGETAAMIHEFNFVLPLELRRVELATKIKEHDLLGSKAAFWDSVSAFIMALVK